MSTALSRWRVIIKLNDMTLVMIHIQNHDNLSCVIMFMPVINIRSYGAHGVFMNTHLKLSRLYNSKPALCLLKRLLLNSLAFIGSVLDCAEQHPTLIEEEC